MTAKEKESLGTQLPKAKHKLCITASVLQILPLHKQCRQWDTDGFLVKNFYQFNQNKVLFKKEYDDQRAAT